MMRNVSQVASLCSIRIRIPLDGVNNMMDLAMASSIWNTTGALARIMLREQGADLQKRRDCFWNNGNNSSLYPYGKVFHQTLRDVTPFASS